MTMKNADADEEYLSSFDVEAQNKTEKAGW